MALGTIKSVLQNQSGFVIFMMISLLTVSCGAEPLRFVSFPHEEVTGQGSGEKWGYVTVRPQAHMFWWLYRTTNPLGDTKVPLVLWLQGGPGGSGTGFGNFEEIGPLDVQQKPREYTWLSEANLLFIDNPVGTGFSYVDSESAYTTDVQQIAADLLSVMKVVMKQNANLTGVPFYIFSESYGGKMTAAFSQVLYKAVQAGQIKCNFSGFAMGDSWISPLDSTNTWAPYLYVNSLIDRSQFDALNATAGRIEMMASGGQWKEATAEWSKLENQVEEATAGVNFYNIQKWGESQLWTRLYKDGHTPFERSILRHLKVYQADDLAALMNGPIRKKLGCIPDHVTWGGQSSEVFVKQSEDFMKAVDIIVDNLIQNTSLKVVVYSGQLDLIVDNLGTERWVYRLTNADSFSKAAKKVMMIEGFPQAFVKEDKNFQYYFILAAGHMVPADNAPTALAMLKRIIGH